jgi:uncharacterized membrane protein HdeD (DUF308 family)
MWWPPFILGIVMFITGILFITKRKLLSNYYVSRIKILPIKHPQYREKPAINSQILAIIGILQIVSGVAVMTLGVFADRLPE